MRETPYEKTLARLAHRNLFGEQYATLKHNNNAPRAPYTLFDPANIGFTLDNKSAKQESGRGKEQRLQEKDELMLAELAAKKQFHADMLTYVPTDTLEHNRDMAKLKELARLEGDIQKAYLEDKLKAGYVIEAPAHEDVGNRRRKYKERLARVLGEDAKSYIRPYSEIEGFVLSLDYLAELPYDLQGAFMTVQAFQDGRELKQRSYKVPIKTVIHDELARDAQYAHYAQLNSVSHIDGMFIDDMVLMADWQNRETRARYLATTYLLIKLYSEETIYVDRKNEFKALEGLPESLPPIAQYKTQVLYGWTVLQLFEGDKLTRGRWQLPLFRTPLPALVQYEGVHSRCRRLRGCKLYLRLEHGGVDPERTVEALGLGQPQDLARYEVPVDLQSEERSFIDEYEESRREISARRRAEYEKAVHKKKIKDELDKRRMNIYNKIKVDAQRERAHEKRELEKQEAQRLDDERKRLMEEKRMLEKMLHDAQMAKLKRKKFEDARLARERQMGNTRYGLRVNFIELRGIKTYHALKLVFGLFVEEREQLDDLGARCVYESDKIIEHIPDKALKAKTPPRIRLALPNQVHEIIKNVNALSTAHFGDKKVYLGVQLLTIEEPEEELIVEDSAAEGIERELKQIWQDQKELLAMQNTKSAGWLMFDLLKSDGSVKSGQFNERLNSAPIVSPPFGPKTKFVHSKTSLVFMLQLFEYNNDSLPFFYERNKQRKKKKMKFKRIKDVEYASNAEPFIVNKAPQYTDKDFYKGAGIDVYIEEARFLPDNSTLR